MSDGSPFDETKWYKVAMNSYRGNGGGELLTKGAGIPHDSLQSRIVYESERDQRYYLMKEIEKEEEIPQGSHGLRRNRRVILQLWEVRAIMSTENRNHPIQTKEAQIMERTRLDDMLERYGEVCTQKVAAQLLNVVPRTIHRMLEEGRLRRVDRRVDVRSICEYIENPKQANFVAKAKNTRPRNTMSESDFFAAAQQGRWAPRR